MIDVMQTILPKTPVFGLTCHIGRSGLCMGDPATLALSDGGEVLLFTQVRRRFLGLVPYRRETALGNLGPIAARILGPALGFGHTFRVRIVGITPEHLSGPRGPEVFVSVWGDPHQLERGR